MSDVLFNEIGVPPSKFYKFGDWVKYAVHDEKNIKGFFGQYRWLSNFHECSVLYEGLLYRSSENAYQAAKLIIPDRTVLQDCSPSKSKKLWQSGKKIDNTAEEWDSRKLGVMDNILFDKFERNTDLRKLLMDTGNKYLEESNHWGDTYWGVDITVGGENRLGKLLMGLREYFQIAEYAEDDPSWGYHL